MVAVADLLLPIVLSAVGVFIVSSLVHMVFQYHTHDFGKIPDEEKALDAIRGAGVPPGAYRFPFATTMKEMGTPEMKAKFERGPVGMLHVMPPGGCGMGASLAQWFALSLVISVVIAYLAGLALAPGAAGKDVFRFVATAGFLGWSLMPVTDSIWKGMPWSVSLKFAFDGLLYALATGAVFAWRWPAA